jgi:membrane protein
MDQNATAVARLHSRLLLVSLTVSTALATARELLEHRYAGLLVILGALDLVASLALVAGVFALIYRWMPAERLRWAVVIAGGLLTAVLFDLGRWPISPYPAHATEPSAFGAAASFAALLLCPH